MGLSQREVRGPPRRAVRGLWQRGLLLVVVGGVCQVCALERDVGGVEPGGVSSRFWVEVDQPEAFHLDLRFLLAITAGCILVVLDTDPQRIRPSALGCPLFGPCGGTFSQAWVEDVQAGTFHLGLELLLSLAAGSALLIADAEPQGVCPPRLPLDAGGGPSLPVLVGVVQEHADDALLAPR